MIVILIFRHFYGWESKLLFLDQPKIGRQSEALEKELKPLK